MSMTIRVNWQRTPASRNSIRFGAFPRIRESFGSRTGRKVFIRLRTEFSLPHCLPIPSGRSAKDSLSCCQMFRNKANRSKRKATGREAPEPGMIGKSSSSSWTSTSFNSRGSNLKRRQPAYSISPSLFLTRYRSPSLPCGTQRLCAGPTGTIRVGLMSS